MDNNYEYPANLKRAIMEELIEQMRNFISGPRPNPGTINIDELLAIELKRYCEMELNLRCEPLEEEHHDDDHDDDIYDGPYISDSDDDDNNNDIVGRGGRKSKKSKRKSRKSRKSKRKSRK